MLRPFVAAPTLVVLLILAGCSDPEPKEPRATASATPTVAAPTMPAQAKESSPEGAAAFVKHYIDVFNYASNTGDVAELSRLSSPDCEGCQSYITLYRDTYKAGGYFKNSDWALNDIEVDQDAKNVAVFARMSTPKGTFRASASGPVKVAAESKADLAIIPRFASAGWLLAKLGLEDDPR